MLRAQTNAQQNDDEKSYSVVLCRGTMATKSAEITDPYTMKLRKFYLVNMHEPVAHRGS